jgi:transcriptional regulator with XRE-family HTH domain
MNKLMKEVGVQVKKIRHQLGLTQAEMAKLYNKTHPRSPDLKVTRVLISKYERADVKMPADKFLKFLAMTPPDSSL